MTIMFEDNAPVWSGAPSDSFGARDTRVIPANCFRPSLGFQESKTFLRAIPTDSNAAVRQDRNEDDSDGDQRADPIAEAREEGYISGFEAGSLARQQADETEAEIAQTLKFKLGQIDEKLGYQLSERLREFALEICMSTLEPLAIDPKLLERRIRLALSMLNRATDKPSLYVNPQDMLLIRGSVPDEVPVLADPSLGRGDIRLEAATGGVEDGPECWRRSIREALQI